MSWHDRTDGTAVAPPGVLRPSTVSEVQQIVADAKSLQVVGAGRSDGRSWADAALSLSAVETELDLDGDAAWLPAGWTLARVAGALAGQGRALALLPDDDAATVGGAFATGAHGSGAGFPCLSALATGFRVVLPGGTLLDCSPEDNDEIFQALRINLGAIGVVIAVRAPTVPLVRLTDSVRCVPVKEMFTRWERWTAGHRHVSFRQFPYADELLLRTQDEADGPDDPGAAGRLSDAGFERLCRVGHRVASLRRPLQAVATRLIPGKPRRGPAHALGLPDHGLRCRMMEYAVPASEGLRAMRAVVREIRKRGLDVMMPLQCGIVKGDDLWLSPWSGGDRVTIAVQQDWGARAEPLFEAVEPVFRAFDGRPHWGMHHMMTPRDLERLYPQLGAWLAVRARVDPAGKLLSPARKALFGL